MDYTIGITVAKAILGNPTLSAICWETSFQCVQTLVVTTQEIYGFVTTIKKTTSHLDIANLLIELDLEPEVLVLESLLKEINLQEHFTQTLAVSLKLLEECLTDILKLLSEVNKKIEYNNKLWISFYGTRCYKFDDVGCKLKLHKKNLDKRKKNLFEILKINSYLRPPENTSPNLKLLENKTNKNMIKEIIHECDDDIFNVSIVSVDKLNVDKLKTNSHSD